VAQEQILGVGQMGYGAKTNEKNGRCGSRPVRKLRCKPDKWKVPYPKSYGETFQEDVMVHRSKAALTSNVYGPGAAPEGDRSKP